MNQDKRRERNKKISIFWKTYAWLYLVIIIVGSLSIFLGLAPINMPTKMSESIISLFATVPLFLFAYNKRWLRQKFWKIFFFIFLLIEIKDIPSFLKMHPNLLFNAFIGIMLSFPCYIAIFLYAFKNEKFQQEKEIN